MVRKLKPHQLGALVSFVLAGLLLLGCAYGLFHLGVFELYGDSERYQQAILNTGPYAPLTYIFFQALQVVLAPIPGEFTGSIAGVLFGGAYGGLYATIGLAIGSSIAFVLGRRLGMPLIKWLISPDQLKKIEFLGKKRGFLLVLVVFLVPGFPKDVATYFFALTPIPFGRFFWSSQLGRLPGTLALTFAGDALMKGDWQLLVILTTAVILIFAAGYFFRKRLLEWIRESD